MVRDLVGRRVVAVHAHPDDESIFTGGTLAQLARRGADVTVVTCTLGEEGEVIGAPFGELVADHADQLGGFRIAELTQALAHLGVRGEFLGAAGRFRDSGMVGSPAHDNPRAFVRRTDEAIECLVEVFRRIRPEVVITYGPDGGYGHPDHIQAHRITHAAAEIVNVPRVVWACADRAEMDEALAAIEKIPAGWRVAQDQEIAAVDGFDAVIDLSDQDYYAKSAAMRAHATQLWLADGSVSATNPQAAYGHASDGHTVFALSNLIAQPLLRREHYRSGAGSPVGGTDLFAGL